jgi:hypothetical protein
MPRDLATRATGGHRPKFTARSQSLCAANRGPSYRFRTKAPLREGFDIRRFLLISSVSICLVLAPEASAQGFGSLSKKKITLHRKLPAVAQFTGSTFNIKAGTRDPKFADMAGSLKDALETELLKDNDRFRVDANSPQLAISCTVADFAIPPPQSFTRNEVVLQKGKQMEQPVKYNKITGSLEVAYQAHDTRSGRFLDADNITAKYSEDFEEGTNQQAGKSLSTKVMDPFKRMAGKKTEDSSGPPTTSELRDKLIRDAVHEIAARITTTDEPVEVMLAQGKLDKANKLADSRLWTRDLEELEQMTPFPGPRDDAYRLYNIGVAYEALAYQSEDHQAAKKFLEEAAINYGKAVDNKPDEKYFLEPQKRIETAMAYYRKIEGLEKTIAALNASPPAPTLAPEKQSTPARVTSNGDSKPAPPTKSAQAATTTASSRTSARSSGSGGTGNTPSGTNSSGTSTGTAAKSSANAVKSSSTPSVPALTNDQIIKMFKAGVDEETIIATIHDAPAVKFDLSPNGAIQLASSGVKGKIVAAMRARSKLSSRRSSESSQ